MGSGFSKKKKQQRLFQEQFSQIQNEIQNCEVTGSSGSGLVQVTLSGDKKIKSVKINPECVDKDDIEGLEDLIVAAFENAEELLEEKSPMGGINPMDLL